VSSVQSIRRAFAVLDALGDGPHGVTDVADRAGLPKSTAARLLATLAEEGAVEQVPGDSAYRLGPRLVALGGGFSLTRTLAAIAHPILAELAAACGEASGLGLPDGDLVHYVDQVDTPNPVVVRDWTGLRAPLHAVSSGQVLLAFRSAAAVDRYLSRPLEALTPRTLVDPDAVRARLREIRRTGYGWAIEEFDPGISSVAAPIADASGEVVAAVHLHGPSYRFPDPGAVGDLSRLVVTGAARIAAGLREASGG
jgi:DNA-binding IclR family transcriptional regulator